MENVPKVLNIIRNYRPTDSGQTSANLPASDSTDIFANDPVFSRGSTEMSAMQKDVGEETQPNQALTELSSSNGVVMPNESRPGLECRDQPDETGAKLIEDHPVTSGWTEHFSQEELRELFENLIPVDDENPPLEAPKGKRRGNRDTSHAQARAAEVNAESGGPLARRFEKTEQMLGWTSIFKLTNDGIAKSVLGINRSGFMRELAREGLLEEVHAKTVSQNLYGLSKLGAQMLGRAYTDPHRFLGGVRHRLAVQQEVLIALNAADILDLDVTRFEVEPHEQKGKKRCDAKLFRNNGYPVRLEVELSKKGGIDLLQMVAHVGDGYNRGILLVTFKDIKLLNFFLLHVFNAMNRGKIPDLRMHEKENVLIRVTDRGVDTFEGFKNVFVKLNGQPWTLDKSQNLIEMFKRCKAEG